MAAKSRVEDHFDVLEDGDYRCLHCREKLRGYIFKMNPAQPGEITDDITVLREHLNEAHSDLPANTRNKLRW